jgi:hypothetical protein
VESVPGTLIDMPARGRRRQVGYTLLWVKNGIIYSLASSGAPDQAVPFAESLN